MKLNIYFPDDLVYLCSFHTQLFLSVDPFISTLLFCSLLYQCFVMLQKSKECEVKFSITYLNRNAREPSQSQAAEKIKITGKMIH